MIELQRLDHLVLTVADIAATCAFYSTVLGCQVIRFKAGREKIVALQIGDSLQKINLHSAQDPFQPAAQMPQPGLADLCFITSTPLIASGEERVALRIGNSSQKINLHSAEYPFQPTAQVPQPGSADLCFITATPLTEAIAHFHSLNIAIVAGPIQRTGTLGPILSVYIRDLDSNLIEVANSLNADSL